jgi:hypothetical protein
MSTPAKKTRIAWIALCALLFSGVSSTLAAVYFSDRMDFLSEICTAVGVKKVAANDDQGGRDAPARGDGGIYCAQCLASAATPVIETSPVVALFALVAGVPAMPSAHPAAHLPAPVLPPPSRGPPAVY